jgi:hypothetical protein
MAVLKARRPSLPLTAYKIQAPASNTILLASLLSHSQPAPVLR